MFNDIFVGVMIVLALAAGIWCWWFENYSHGDEKTEKEEERGGKKK